MSQQQEITFADKSLLALNEIATIVLDWNCGNLKEVEALKKINKVFVKIA